MSASPGQFTSGLSPSVEKNGPGIAKKNQNTGSNRTHLSIRAENLHLEQTCLRFLSILCVLATLTRYRSALPTAQYVKMCESPSHSEVLASILVKTKHQSHPRSL